MDAIRYLDADTILDYLHNSSETYLEGLIPQSYGFPTEMDRSVYVRLLKVPVRDKASEVYMQAIPYKTFEGDSNRPIEEFGKDTKFEKVGVVIDSSRLWLMEPLWRICTQSRQKFDDADFVSEFWDAFTRKVLKEYAVDAGVEKSEAVKNLAKQYAILDMLSKREKPVYFGCIENALQTLYPVSVLGCYKKVAAARLASKMTNMFVPTKNESQKTARHLLNSYKGTVCKKNIVDVTLCNKNAGNMQIKIPLDNFLYYEPKTKEIFVNICDICEGERKKVNRYVKDCGFFVRENLVPMMLVQRFEA